MPCTWELVPRPASILRLTTVAPSWLSVGQLTELDISMMKQDVPFCFYQTTAECWCLASHISLM
jgi:hypothetical protein